MAMEDFYNKDNFVSLLSSMGSMLSGPFADGVDKADVIKRCGELYEIAKGMEVKQVKSQGDVSKNSERGDSFSSSGDFMEDLTNLYFYVTKSSDISWTDVKDRCVVLMNLADNKVVSQGHSR